MHPIFKIILIKVEMKQVDWCTRMWVNVSVLCVCCVRACTCMCVVGSVRDSILFQTIQATVILLPHPFPFVFLFLIFYPVLFLWYDKQNCIIPQEENSEMQIILVVQWWIFNMKCREPWNNYSKPNVSNL